MDFSADAPVEERIRRMTAALRHRGPDHQDVFVAPPILLGHTRLSIIDLAPTGNQPMLSEDGRVALVYNGEIYNFPELRGELERAGHAFRGTSDTEVVLRAYLQWGDSIFARFNGMFAIALWDGRTQELHLARDRFGIKPLFFAPRGRALLFGSEIKALLAWGGLERRLDWTFLHEYLYFGNSLRAGTAFEGIYKVLPGTHLRITRTGISERRFFDLNHLESRAGDLEAYTRGVREHLEAAVRRHLISDVPVALFLSGGIDSSAIATFAARHYRGRLKTYTAGFEHGGDVDERPRARKLAQALGTEHSELFVRVSDIRQLLAALVRAHDEPFADPANIPLYLLAGMLAGESVKVVLQGDGGDEIFAGYRRYNVLAWERLWRALAPIGRSVLLKAPRGLQVQRALRFLRAIGQREPSLRMALLLTVEDAEDPPSRVLSADARAQLRSTDPFRAYREVAAQSAGRDALTRMLYCDALLLLPDTFLAKVDRATMAHGVEVRVPFLDAELTDFALRIPSGYKVRGLAKKYLLRRALRGIVPDEILDAPKMGLNVPYSRWLRTDLRGFAAEVLLGSANGLSGLLDRQVVEGMLLEHARGERDNGFLLYKLLNLALWHEEYLSSATSQWA